MMPELTLLVTLACHHLIASGVILVMLIVVSKAVKLSAEAQSWLWMTGFMLSTLLPLLTFNVVTKTPLQEVSLSTPVLAEPQGSIVAVQNVEPLMQQQWHVPGEWVWLSQELLFALLILWGLGALWRGYQVAKAALQSRRLLQTAVNSTFPDVGNVKVLLCRAAASPLVMGLWQPVVILPHRFVQELSDKQLKAIVLHELAHIRRGDLWFSLFQELLAIVFWWSPAVRLLNHKIHLYRELACDLRAAEGLDNTADYAQSLLDSARLMLTQHKSVLAMGLFSKKKDLEFRIDSVLRSQSTSASGSVKIALGCFAFFCSGALLAQQMTPVIDLQSLNRDAKQYARQSPRYSSELLNAVEVNDFDKLNELIEQGTDINVPLLRDGTALMIAIKNNNADMAQALIARGADVEQASQGDGNPLIIAAQRGYLDMARLLLDQGANVNAMVEGDESPLIRASWAGHLAMVQLLVSEGADVNLGTTANQSFQPEWRSPLSKAANPQIRDYLVSQGAIQ